MRGLASFCAVLCTLASSNAVPINQNLSELIEAFERLGITFSPDNSEDGFSGAGSGLGSSTPEFVSPSPSSSSTTGVPSTASTVPVSTPSQSQCGKQTIKPRLSQWKKIIDGKAAVPHSWPWQVSLFHDNEAYCGGSIVNRNTVITAAHCFEKRKLKDFTVISGMHRLSDDHRTRSVSKISQAYIHPQYYDADYDIAVVKLLTPVNYSAKIKPICLPAQSQVTATGKKCVVTGWGETRRGVPESEPNEDSDELLQVKTTVVGAAFCNKHYSNSLIDNTFICGTASNGDACQGDSGGPMQCENPDGSWYLAGIVSWGDSCGGSSPGVYTKVEYFLKWIATKM